MLKESEKEFSVTSLIDSRTGELLVKGIREGNVGITRDAIGDIRYSFLSDTLCGTELESARDIVKELSAVLFFISKQAGLNSRIALQTARDYIEDAKKISARDDFRLLINSEFLSYAGKIGEIIPGRNCSEIVNEAMSYIEQHLYESVTTKAIAQHLHLSVCNICRMFKEQTGITITTYTNRRRIEHAAYLLTSTPLSMNEISKQSGFSSCNYFKKAFRRVKGMSPKEYRTSVNKETALSSEPAV